MGDGGAQPIQIRLNESDNFHSKEVRFPKSMWEKLKGINLETLKLTKTLKTRHYVISMEHKKDLNIQMQHMYYQKTISLILSVS